MRPAAHLRLAIIGPLVWAAFLLAGWPDYYQQYPPLMNAFGTALLVPPTAWIGWRIIRRGKSEQRLARAAWLSFWFTVPFCLLDSLYCGWWLGEGPHFLVKYWYLTSFYFIPWLLWLPMPKMMKGT